MITGSGDLGGQGIPHDVDLWRKRRGIEAVGEFASGLRRKMWQG